MKLKLIPWSLLIGSVCLSACNQQLSPSNRGLKEKQRLQEKIEEIRQKTRTNSSLNIYVGIDISGSMKKAGIAPTTFSDIKPVLAAISRNGGEFALGAICDRDQALIRVDFPEPPILDLSQLPEKPDKKKYKNPIQRKNKLDEYERAVAQMEPQVKEYEKAIAMQARENQERITKIKPEIEKLLQQPKDCKETDINMAVQRAQVFFEETNHSSVKPRKYAIFITDGKDTVTKKSVRMDADKILLVTNNMDSNVFSSIAHQKFESPNAAFKQLAMSINQN